MARLKFFALLLISFLAPPLAAQTHIGGKSRAALGTGAAFDAAGNLWLVSIEDGRLALRHSSDKGMTWSAPGPLDTLGDPISADGENRPKIAFGPGGSAVISYTKPLAQAYTGDIRLLRSTDGGSTWSKPLTVHDDRQAIAHRFESIAFDKQGDLHIVWIDKRMQASSRQGKKPSDSGAAIFRKRSTDAGATFGPDIKVADRSCECCRIALIAADEGGVAALWRHIFDQDMRDHAFSRWQGEAAQGAVSRASHDGWRLQVCPHHGPGLARAAGGGYHAVWFGERAGIAAVRYGRLDANGQPIGEARLLPDGAAEHADVASDGPIVAIVWRSFDGKAARLNAWISSDGGHDFSLRTLAQTEDESDHPRLALDGRTPYVIWRTTNEIHIYRLLP